MEFVRPRLGQDVLPASAVESMDEGREVMVAGWPVARQHPRGKEGTVFVTIEDETGDVQLILWAKVFAMRRRELGSQVILVRGVVSRWDGTTNIVVSDVRRVDTGVSNARRPRLALKMGDRLRRQISWEVIIRGNAGEIPARGRKDSISIAIERGIRRWQD